VTAKPLPSSDGCRWMAAAAPPVAVHLLSYEAVLRVRTRAAPMVRSEDTLSSEQKDFAAADLQTAEWNAALFEIEMDNWSTYVRRVLHARKASAVRSSTQWCTRADLQRSPCGRTVNCGNTALVVQCYCAHDACCDAVLSYVCSAALRARMAAV
jgi:hypothetical protein